jgi:hypothetical protein
MSHLQLVALSAIPTQLQRPKGASILDRRPTRETKQVADAAANEVNDPGWVIVAGLAVFFAVAASVIALT